MLRLVSELWVRDFRQVCGYCAVGESSFIPQYMCRRGKIALHGLNKMEETKDCGGNVSFIQNIKVTTCVRRHGVRRACHLQKQHTVTGRRQLCALLDHLSGRDPCKH